MTEDEYLLLTRLIKLREAERLLRHVADGNRSNRHNALVVMITTVAGWIEEDQRELDIQESAGSSTE